MKAIQKIQKGWVNDDFVHNRETLMVWFKSEGPRDIDAVKLYINPDQTIRLAMYNDSRFQGGQYTETDLPEEYQRAILEHINQHGYASPE